MVVPSPIRRGNECGSAASLTSSLALMRMLLIPPLLAAVLCAGCRTGHPLASLPEDTIRSPERVLAYRVSGDNVLTAEVLRKHRASGGTGLPKVEEGKYVQGYPILLGPVEVPRPDCRKLSRMLTDRRNYGYGGIDAWSPAIAFRFYGEKGVMEVLVSYQDSSMSMYEHGELVFCAPILPMQNQLIELVDSFLPRANEVE